jgi:hypothetical protein
MEKPDISIVPALFIGDLVVIREEHQRQDDKGVVFEITKINPVNWSLSPINAGRTLRCPPHLLRKATDDEIAAARTATPVPTVHSGTVVTVAGPGWKQPPDRLWCVLRLKGQHGVELGRLGGDANIYRNVPRTYLTPLSDEQIAAMTAAAKA